MSQLSPSYQIDRPTRQCAFTHQPLDPGQPYMATLIEADGDGAAGEDKPKPDSGGLVFRRVDVSLEAWEQGQRPDRMFGFWKTKVPQPTEKKKPFVNDEVLVNLFRRLADTHDSQRLGFRFVLALLLMRKKLLRYEASQQRPSDGGDQEWWQLTLKSGPWAEVADEAVEVLNPQLDEQQIKQVSEQLSEILEAEL